MCYKCTLKMTIHRFKASDGKGGVAAVDVSINLCNCSDHGECLFDLLADGYELKQTFRIVQCNCSIGWEGQKAIYNNNNKTDTQIVWNSSSDGQQKKFVKHNIMYES